MEEHFLTEPPEFKLYKERAIALATFLGGPLVAGYLAAENYRQLGDKGRVRGAWAIAIVATIIIFGGLFLVPDIEKVPRYIIPIIYMAVTQSLVQKYQGAAIKSHIEKGGQTYSMWRAVWIGLVGLVVLFAILLVVAAIVGYRSPQ